MKDENSLAMVGERCKFVGAGLKPAQKGQVIRLRRTPTNRYFRSNPACPVAQGTMKDENISGFLIRRGDPPGRLYIFNGFYFRSNDIKRIADFGTEINLYFKP